MVIATQNPVEFEGTFPLPEAQLDRFMMRISIGYPSREDEMDILDMESLKNSIKPVVKGEELLKAIKMVKEIEVKRNIKKYIIDIINETRTIDDVLLPASPRASQDLYKASKSLAMIRNRKYVIPEDVAYLAPYIISHRIVLNSEARFKGMDEFQLISDIAKSIRIEINEEK